MGERIRDAVEADLPAIVEIYNFSIPGRQATGDLEPVSIDSRRSWFEQHNPDRRPILVIEIDQKVIGWASLSDFYEGRAAYHATAEVGIYIATDFHGSGYGKKLLEAVMEISPQLGIDTLLAIYFDHNVSSRKLFCSYGFEEMGHLRDIADLDGERRGVVIGVKRLVS